ncbi:hypothetical protein KRR38_29070 [Novosphingobium sp. G106]|uniref:hypothetical protein n=1 Tax=Novosphingobium sp. G106 TaxID=2849500 RepID=UPI001C2D774E|nr:hypothetical protein [Novosphingobium sp. G106]MBV1691618.1 hypothetical protein [Novosphingobium sp. G106]
MFPSKPDRVLAAGIALLVQSFVTSPLLATELAPLDDAVLRQSAAPAAIEDREPGEKAAKSEQPAERDQQDDRHADISQIVRPTETELRTTTPELPLGLNIRPAESSRLSDPTTNLVFSGNLSTGLGTTAP